MNSGIVEAQVNSRVNGWQGPLTNHNRAQCSRKLSVAERGVYAASLSLIPQILQYSNLVGSFTLKRPEGRAPTNRQLVDAPSRSGHNLIPY